MAAGALLTLLAVVGATVWFCSRQGRGRRETSETQDKDREQPVFKVPQSPAPRSQRRVVIVVHKTICQGFLSQKVMLEIRFKVYSFHLLFLCEADGWGLTRRRMIGAIKFRHAQGIILKSTQFSMIDS